MQLLDVFPLEAGEEGPPRIIPFLPGQRVRKPCGGGRRAWPALAQQMRALALPVRWGRTSQLYVTENVCKERQVELDAYCQFFVRLPEHMLRSVIVKEFFECNPADEAASLEMVIAAQTAGLGFYEDGPAAHLIPGLEGYGRGIASAFCVPSV